MWLLTRGYTLHLFTLSLCMYENNLWDSFLSFHHVAPGDGIQVARLGSECLVELSHQLPFEHSNN